MKLNKTALQKKETPANEVERTENRATYVPFTDIIERADGLTINMDVPGAVEKSIDIKLEDNILSVHARVETEEYKGYRPLYSEYRAGDFQRSFRLQEHFDENKIDATLINGVLHIDLPKSEKMKPRKIEIKS